tara:strand:- start:27961 stop:28371 length:411 start_codon:yes stop_codon:yes gene_type:complete
MAATTHRGITYTGTGTYTTAVNIDLPLWAGVDQDDETWLTAYPGALTSFSPRQTDGTNRSQPRLVCLTLSAALADTNTLTLSGECSKILSVVGQHLDATAIMGVTKTSDLVLTFALKQHDDSAADVSATELWLIVA